MLYAALVVKTIMNTVSSILEYVRLTFLMEKSSCLTVKSSKIFYYNINSLYCDTVETTKIVNSKICLIVKSKFTPNASKQNLINCENCVMIIKIIYAPQNI